MAHPMTAVAPTVADALGLRPPVDAIAEPIEQIATDLRPAERIAVIAPDALGWHQLEHFQDTMPFLWSLCEEGHVILRSVMPSVTCVNFATMITGCDLDGHGIASKEFNVQCETIFDVLAESEQQGAGCGRSGYTGGELLARASSSPRSAAPTITSTASAPPRRG